MMDLIYDARILFLSGLILWPLCILGLISGYALLVQIAINAMPDSEND